MNNVNPMVDIEIRYGRKIPSATEWMEEVKKNVKNFLTKMNLPFSEVEFEDEMKKGTFWHLSISGINFKIRNIKIA